jgi:hypothetical protein
MRHSTPHTPASFSSPIFLRCLDAQSRHLDKMENDPGITKAKSRAISSQHEGLKKKSKRLFIFSLLWKFFQKRKDDLFFSMVSLVFRVTTEEKM